MTWLLILILLSTCMGALALGAFLWSLRGGQYDDMEGAATRILFDDPPPRRVRWPRSGRPCGCGTSRRAAAPCWGIAAGSGCPENAASPGTARYAI